MVKGIDVSHYQRDKGTIDWKKAASSVDFVFIKASEGISFVDGAYKESRDGARAAGLLVGSYHFAGGGDPLKEADHFLDTVGELKEGELLALDWEIGFSGNPAEWCRVFLSRVKEKTGIKPLLYTNEARVRTIDWSGVVKGDFGLWVAKYGENDGSIPQSAPTSGQWAFWALWQYTSRGAVDGVKGFVDMDTNPSITLETLRKYGKKIECSHCKIHCPS